jgi:hypothetical protein
MQTTNPDINKLKDIARQKGQIAQIPPNGSAALIIKDHAIAKKGVVGYNCDIGVGKVIVMGKFFDVVGYAKHSEQFPLQESSVRTTLDELKAPKEGAQVLVVTFPDTFLRKMDEARWAGKLDDLPGLIALLESL